MPQITDVRHLELLVEAAQRGDRVAIETLMLNISPIIDRFVRSKIRAGFIPNARQSDVVQSVLVKVLNGLDDYRPLLGRDFLAWLLAASANKVIDIYRKARRRTRGLEEIDDRDVNQADSEQGPFEVAATADDVRAIVDRIQQLTPALRDVLEMRLLGGMTYDQIADVLGRTRASIKMA